MYDIIFLSYNETKANEHWNLLSCRFPTAQRVHGVKGIADAHKAAARAARTEFFWVVDGDNIVVNSFDFFFEWDEDDEEAPNRVMVFQAINSVNGLVYGNGGVKLFPKKAVLAFDKAYIDFSLNVTEHYEINEIVASTTVIDASPFEAWCAGFREGAKLTLANVVDTYSAERANRLKLWQEECGDSPYGYYCVKGATDGISYVNYKIDVDHGIPDFSRINDFDWLERKFRTCVDI